MSLVTFTGIAVNKTIPVNEIMFYRVTLDRKEKKGSVCTVKHFWHIRVTALTTTTSVTW
jgi:hypothetical protein